MTDTAHDDIPAMLGRLGAQAAMRRVADRVQTVLEANDLTDVTGVADWGARRLEFTFDRTAARVDVDMSGPATVTVTRPGRDPEQVATFRPGIGVEHAIAMTVLALGFA